MEPQQPLPPPEAPPQIPPFPGKYNTLIFVPIILLLFVMPATLASESNLIFTQPVLVIAAAVAVGYLLYIQSDYFRQFYPSKKVTTQLILIAGTLLLPVIAINLGDILGAAHYSVETDGFLPSTGMGLLISSVLAMAFATVFAVGNMIYIATHGTSTALKIIGSLLYWLACIAVAGLSFICYTFIYSLHDPSTE